MKFKLPLILLLLIVIGGGAATGWYIYDNQRPEIDYDIVRIGVDVPYPPYSFLNNNGELTGFEIDLGNATCAYLEIQCEWVITPFDEIIDNLLAGQFDAIMSSMTIKPDRSERIDFGEAYYTVPSVLFARKSDNIGSASASALANLRIGTIASTAQEDYLTEKYGDAIQLKTYETNEDVNQAMRSGELDLVFHDYPHWEREFMVDGGYEIVGDPVRIGAGVGMGFRPGDDALRKLFNQGLKEMKRNGTYTMIRKKYLFFDVMVD